MAVKKKEKLEPVLTQGIVAHVTRILTTFNR